MTHISCIEAVCWQMILNCSQPEWHHYKKQVSGVHPVLCVRGYKQDDNFHTMHWLGVEAFTAQCWTYHLEALCGQLASVKMLSEEGADTRSTHCTQYIGYLCGHWRWLEPDGPWPTGEVAWGSYNSRWGLFNTMVPSLAKWTQGLHVSPARTRKFRNWSFAARMDELKTLNSWGAPQERTNSLTKPQVNDLKQNSANTQLLFGKLLKKLP